MAVLPYNRFHRLRRGLVVLNLIYILLATGLVTLVWLNHEATVVSLRAYGGILWSSGLLVLIALIGLIGTLQHHQVILFFYMVILFVVFVGQFSVSCSLHIIDKSQQKELAHESWEHASPELRNDTEVKLRCCGFGENSTEAEAGCFSDALCCSRPGNDCRCPPCWPVLQERFERGLSMVGTIGGLFSFCLLLGVWTTFCYRNTKDPAKLMSPNAFL
ncbi:tetraspanin-13-like [Varroa jacobsoni]|uniref:Uncharacterized protein n=1 Tax=Varroa destructor TaxID=109461 RepID=A0A7M7L182_VARDE|nr:tetraspanin-13-like [Varroa destructor]XP_022705697.1 tetraspanin-13-like [Varroa jacobsoni]